MTFFLSSIIFLICPAQRGLKCNMQLVGRAYVFVLFCVSSLINIMIFQFAVTGQTISS